MRTVVLDPPPPELAALIERRHATGADLYDEIWDGDYHMVPGPHTRHANVQGQLLALLHEPATQAGLGVFGPFNLGEPGNFRVPDGGICRTAVDKVYAATADLVLEVLSPGDETYDKFEFYHAHHVAWILVAEPDSHRVRLFRRDDQGFEEVRDCPPLGIAASQLAEMIRWP